NELGGVELTPTSKISKHFSSQPVDEHINIIVQHPVETKEIHCTGGKAKKSTKYQLSVPPVEVESCGNTKTKSLPCYLDRLPIHAKYSCMEEDWVIEDVILSNNLKGTGIIRRGHFNFSDTVCTSQISDEHWKNVLTPFLTRHKLKKALSTEDDEKKLVEMFGEENKQKLLEQGNLKLIVSLCDTEEDTIKVLEIVKRIRLALYLKEFSDCRTLNSLETKWTTSIPSDILDKRLRDICWASELIKWVIMQWQDGTFLKETKEPWVKTQLTSQLLGPVIAVKHDETEYDVEKIVANNKKLLSPKIKAKIRIDGLDYAKEFENVWVELKGTQHESENSNNLEDIDVMLKGFSVMSATQALTMPEEAKKKIGELEFFGIRGIGNHFQFWGCRQTSRYLMCSYLLGEFYLPLFEGREGSGLQELLHAISVVYSFKTRVEVSKLAFHRIMSSAIYERNFNADSPIQTKRV
ncbi:288_t:CDS:2, partial [Acaulospora morrowiae]